MLEKILPTINKGLSNTGFIFGAGTSLRAGYPLSKDLTKKVIEKLSNSELELLKFILTKRDIEYNFKNGEPDIEIISDNVSHFSLTTGESKYKDLENSIRNYIFQIMKSIKEPKIDLHITFLKAIKRLIGPRPETIFIFTTNYDLLFETAAQYARLPIFNGFTGTIFRYFDINSLNLKYGLIGRNRNFREMNEPKIKLLKLHGSISWKINNGKVFEIGNYRSLNPDDSSIILPRKQKTRDTLKYPYDRIFHYTSNIIGSSQCKYVVSCGYSFRDDHINDLFILPKLHENKIRLFAFFKEEPENIDRFKESTSFNYITQETKYVNGEKINQSSELWKFSEFVNILAKKAGVE